MTLSTSKTTTETIEECFAMMKEFHPNWNPNADFAANLWHHALRQYDPTIVKEATWNIAISSKYIPKIAEVIEEIEAIQKKRTQEVPVIEDKFEAYIRAKDTEWDKLPHEEKRRQSDLINRFIDSEKVELDDYQKYRAELLRGIRDYQKGKNI